MLRGLLITGYFYLVSNGLLYLTNDFNKTPDSMLFLAVFPITFVAFILFYIITAVLMLMNKRFLFDQLSGSYYTSTIQNEVSTKLNTVESHVNSQTETKKRLKKKLT